MNLLLTLQSENYRITQYWKGMIEIQVSTILERAIEITRAEIHYG
jgi:hypothetical protein